MTRGYRLKDALGFRGICSFWGSLKGPIKGSITAPRRVAQKGSISSNGLLVGFALQIEIGRRFYIV